MLFYIRDLSIHGFCYLRWVLKQISLEYQETMVKHLTHTWLEYLAAGMGV